MRRKRRIKKSVTTKNDDNSFSRTYYSNHFNHRNATKIGKGESPLPHYIMEVLIMTSKTIRNINSDLNDSDDHI